MDENKINVILELQRASLLHQVEIEAHTSFQFIKDYLWVEYSRSTTNAEVYLYVKMFTLAT